MLILGINAFHPDASACILKDGSLIAFAEEERFNRIKHCAGFPSKSIKYCLKEARASLSDVDYITVSRSPGANLGRRLISLVKHPKRTLYVLKERVGNVLNVYDIKQHIATQLGEDIKNIRAKVYNIEHHLAHVASAYYPSGFTDSLAVTIDAFGDFASMIVCVCSGNSIEVKKRVLFPHSLGIWYTSICQLLGFNSFGDEGKVMALASFGSPNYMDKMQLLCRNDDSNLFKINLDYFLHHTEGVSMSWGSEKPRIGRLYNDNMAPLFGCERQKHEPITSLHHDIAHSLQKRLEDCVISILTGLKTRYSQTRLSLAGGVCYNCVMNGMIIKNRLFDDVYIQCAAGDSGTAIGSALYFYHSILNKPRELVMEHAYYGPEFSNDEIERALQSYRLKYKKSSDICRETAAQISKSKVVGWFQGRMEAGPRALGNRSIVADPRDSRMKDILNSRIKHREPFRPFAPSVMFEHRNDYFELGTPSPFMITIDWFKQGVQGSVPSVVHVDGTGRVQTVSKDSNSRYWTLINEFYKLSNVPLVLNTSFNEDEPIVCTPTDAIECFIKTKMDILSIGDLIVGLNGENTPF